MREDIAGKIGMIELTMQDLPNTSHEYVAKSLLAVVRDTECVKELLVTH